MNHPLTLMTLANRHYVNRYLGGVEKAGTSGYMILQGTKPA